jgi:hypothetical protein
VPAIGGLHAATRHYFCQHCMSWMFTRPEGMDWFVNIRSTMLDDPEGTAPFVETWTAEKLAFAETGAVHNYEGAVTLLKRGRAEAHNCFQAI